ncbi:cation:proton antiporter [Corynebacterium sp. L4756]|uniref:cation:proton antiporter n=1 Tax=unclassified Corynebacterium TaxID=2624378 RepID=UPI00374D5556
MGILEIISDIFLVLGAFNFAVCAAGMLSFRDAYARISVLSTASGFGVTFILIGAFMRDPSWWNVLVGIAAIILLLGTSAIGSILISRAAMLRRVEIVDCKFNEADPYYGDPEALAREQFMRDDQMDRLS